MNEEIPADAYELLSPEEIEYWMSSGAQFGDDLPPELESLRHVTEEYRAEGTSELEIVCVVARMVRSPGTITTS